MNVRYKLFRILLVAVVSLISVLASAFADTSVVIKQNAQNKAKSDIYIKDAKTGKLTKFITVTDVYTDHYHNAEYRNGYLYVIKRPGGPYAYETNPNWTDELWQYSKTGEAVKVWSERGLDFRVSENGNLVSILTQGNENICNNTLNIVRPDGKRIKKYESKELAITCLDFERWSGKYLWVKEQEAVDITEFMRIDTASMKVDKFDVSKLNLTIEDYAFNCESLLLAYSDYPPMFDDITFNEFEKSKRPITLYVYNLKSKKSVKIDESVAKQFIPKWIGADILEYDSPEGKGRARKYVK